MIRWLFCPPRECKRIRYRQKIGRLKEQVWAQSSRCWSCLLWSATDMKAKRTRYNLHLSKAINIEWISNERYSESSGKQQNLMQVNHCISGQAKPIILFVSYWSIHLCKTTKILDEFLSLLYSHSIRGSQSRLTKLSWSFSIATFGQKSLASGKWIKWQGHGFI